MPKSVRTQPIELIPELLRDRREGLGLRQRDLALRIGQSQAKISRVERGVHRLDVVELSAWLMALDISFLSFMKQLDTRLKQRPDQVFRPKKVAAGTKAARRQ